MNISLYSFRIIIISAFILFTNDLISQEIVEDKIDEFTNNSVKRTSWEKLVWEMDLTVYYRISKINEIVLIELKASNRSVFSIAKDQELMLKLVNGEIIKLLNVEYVLTCTGCGAIGLNGSGAEGIHATYMLDKETIDKIKVSQIEKIRIYTSKGYFEKELKEKFAKSIISSISLI